ncbi:hypothetical protein [Micromonospora musae]|uniref:Uncharacterized protein n=1 Tax=Micromonospora musae TaxID=1894970 RepID=A0A3A9Y1Y6_9ACTN|nr:hypothetical protein [Micromonospora musae]RKN25547.1 hypothetical protein D7044_31190 [Micromonospora musae]
MTELTIEFIGDDPQVNFAVQKWIADRGAPAATTDSGVAVQVNSWDDCEQIGSLLSTFIGQRKDSFELRIDGPGGTSTIHEVRMVADAESMKTFLATCAYLQ